jgi:hypothetical protein
MSTVMKKSEPEGSVSRRVFAEAFRELALRMALHCVRNTIIEDYHAAGKLTDNEMAALNREVANKIYSFLQIMFNPHYEAIRPLAFKWLYAPQGWDQPQHDKSFLLFLKHLKGEQDERKANYATG